MEKAMAKIKSDVAWIISEVKDKQQECFIKNAFI